MRVILAGEPPTRIYTLLTTVVTVTYGWVNFIVITSIIPYSIYNATSIIPYNIYNASFMLLLGGK